MNLDKNYAKLVPQSADDLWHLYNVIRRDDEVYANTTREVKPDEKYGRPGRGERIPVFLGVRVEEVSWDKFLGRLRVHGTICEAPETVPTGAHHTLSVTVNTPVTIVKDVWAEHDVDRLRRATRTLEKPIIIVSVDDEGFAVATTSQFGVQVRAEERVKLPGKLEAERRSDAMRRYFERILGCLRGVWAEGGYPIVIIGVGFFKNDFVSFLRAEAGDIAGSVMDVKSVNNGGMAGVQEALRSGVLMKAFKELRVGEESAVVEEVLKRLGKGDGTVAYGLSEVERAVGFGAVERLVVADSVLRDASDEMRLRLERLMLDVERRRGSVMIVSTEHEAGEKLLGLGGVAAVLRFPI
jgi:protein pelota